ncbi:hypothetical protein VTL71DRAFT_10035, partial [Oculimacula yallundae]
MAFTASDIAFGATGSAFSASDSRGSPRQASITQSALTNMSRGQSPSPPPNPPPSPSMNLDLSDGGSA